MSSHARHLKRVVAQPIVLLVDDNPAQLKLGQILLSAAGFQVETATSALEALEKARRIGFDAIVSDVVMAGIDGFELCHQLRSDASLGEVPIVLMSSFHRGEDDQWLAERVGAAALVERTPDLALALDALRHALGGPSPLEVETDPDNTAPIDVESALERRCRELERKQEELEEKLEAIARRLSGQTNGY